MGAGLGAPVRLHEDDDMQRLRELLMEQLHLVETGRHVALDRGCFEGGQWEVIGIDHVAIRAMGAPPGVGASRRAGQPASYRSLDIRCRWCCRAICRALWLPKCPSSTT